MDWGGIDNIIGIMIPMLNERERRLFIGACAKYLGRGASSHLNQLTGMSRVTINKGIAELENLAIDPKAKPSAEELSESPIRASGGGKKSINESAPETVTRVLDIVNEHTVGNPMNPLVYTTLSTYNLSDMLKAEGHEICPTTVRKILTNDGFSLQQNRKYVEKSATSDERAPQFDHINEVIRQAFNDNIPVISVDAKKKELVGNYKNAGAEWRNKGDPRKVNGHDFEGEGGKAAPYGIYDLGANEGFVNVGISSDTAEFAVHSIKQWYLTLGKYRYPDSKQLIITADCGGSNGYRSRLWKYELQKFANEFGIDVKVLHFPPGTSKWNKIEHRLFAQISRTWRGVPLESLEIIVSLIESTKTKTGLKVSCQLDEEEYKTGIVITDEQMKSLSIERDAWKGEWNYTIKAQA